MQNNITFCSSPVTCSFSNIHNNVEYRIVECRYLAPYHLSGTTMERCTEQYCTEHFFCTEQLSIVTQTSLAQGGNSVAQVM